MRLCIKSSLTVAIKQHFKAISAFFLVTFSSAAVAKDSLHLSDPLGHHRLLVLCLLNENYAESANLELLYDNTDWNGFLERDLIFIEMTKDNWQVVRGKLVLNPNTGQKEANWERIVNTSANPYLRREAACQNDMDYVLIGNDGTQKMRWKNSIPPDELFDRIDSMPLRQSEIRYKNKWR